MSTAALDDFYSRVCADRALESEALGALEAGPSAVVALGAREGFAFSEDELTAALAERGGDLSDDDLDLVSAGERLCSTASA